MTFFIGLFIFIIWNFSPSLVIIIVWWPSVHGSIIKLLSLIFLPADLDWVLVQHLRVNFLRCHHVIWDPDWLIYFVLFAFSLMLQISYSGLHHCRLYDLISLILHHAILCFLSIPAEVWEPSLLDVILFVKSRIDLRTLVFISFNRFHRLHRLRPSWNSPSRSSTKHTESSLWPHQLRCGRLKLFAFLRENILQGFRSSGLLVYHVHLLLI